MYVFKYTNDTNAIYNTNSSGKSTQKCIKPDVLVNNVVIILLRNIQNYCVPINM